MITPVSKRLDYEISMIEQEIIKLVAKKDGLWKAKNVAEHYEADVAREAEAVARRTPKTLGVPLADAPFGKASALKVDPTRNIVPESDDGSEDTYTLIPKGRVTE